VKRCHCAEANERRTWNCAFVLLRKSEKSVRHLQASRLCTWLAALVLCILQLRGNAFIELYHEIEALKNLRQVEHTLIFELELLLRRHGFRSHRVITAHTPNSNISSYIRSKTPANSDIQPSHHYHFHRRRIKWLRSITVSYKNPVDLPSSTTLWLCWPAYALSVQ